MPSRSLKVVEEDSAGPISESSMRRRKAILQSRPRARDRTRSRCARRQYNLFLGQERGGNAERFIENAIPKATFRRMNRPIAPSLITSVQALLRTNRRAGQSQPTRATTIPDQDQTHGFRLRVCPSRASVPGHGNRETGLLFRQPWNRSQLLAWARLQLERAAGPRRPDTSWTSSRSSSRARLARRLLWSVLATSTGRSESHQLGHLLAAVQRSVRSAGLVPGGIGHSGPVYVSEGGEHFLALVLEAGRGPNGMPLDPEVRRLLDHVSRSRSVRTTADGLVRQAPTGATQR